MRLVARPGGFPVGLVAAAAAGLAALAVRAFGLDRLPIPMCTFRALTGHPCLSCGSTRALGLLARFEAGAAFRMQPLATLVAGAVSVWGLIDLILWSRRKALGLQCSPREAFLLTWAAVALALINWAYLWIVHR